MNLGILSMESNWSVDLGSFQSRLHYILSTGGKHKETPWQLQEKEMVLLLGGASKVVPHTVASP
jgi:hypothetical protein